MVTLFVCLLEEIIVVNMEPEPTFKKTETVVKLDSVSFTSDLNQLKQLKQSFFIKAMD